MAPGKYNLTIYRGDTFAQTFHFTTGGVSDDLTGWTFTAQVREYPNASVAADFTVTVDDPPSGEVTIAMADTVTATIPRRGGSWDLEGTDGGEVRTRLAGSITLVEDVTR